MEGTRLNAAGAAAVTTNLTSRSARRGVLLVASFIDNLHVKELWRTS